ncbi:putative Ecdysteroid kinase-containing protein 16 [Homarus americanus]|uniref:Putative Ecdysteroid kinase-containing protein 16 n=1 Tax=Homarus americanus TaxID=6706 RepID=A0A8J5TCC4_HOMAM|nr:putative Ecdysteroid kinase-containing protein 16 [Homarus americanus]
MSGDGATGGLTPHVTEDGVRRTLHLDQGQDATLLHWACHDFTNKGDNYIAIITSVNVKFSKGGSEQQVSYVVKIKQVKDSGSTSDFDDMVFIKEGKFYTEIMPLINAELVNVGMTPLRVPCCLHSEWDEKQNELFLEDLQPLGFKLHDRKKVMSTAHAVLVLQELARLHAASFIVLSKTPQEDLIHKFKFLSWEMFNYSEKTKKAFDALISGSLLTASELAGAVDREDMKEWFRALSPRGPELLAEQMSGGSAFDVISHGDCWVNNLMFRSGFVFVPMSSLHGIT